MSSVRFKKTEKPETPEQLAEYECWVCTIPYTLDEGVITCDAHFACNDCIVHAFESALSPGWECFPVQCCDDTPIGVCLVEHLLTPDMVEKYKTKERERYVPESKLVFCHSCNKWQSPAEFIDTQRSTYSACSCGTNTCVGCKSNWEGDNHRCTAAVEKPDWMPDYSPDCRIKPCPACRMWIELKEACNHMTCKYCRHEFCFLCKMNWDGGHEGCLQTGDPLEGYDEEGYENTPRGLHVHSGLNRQGLNRLGERPVEQQLADINDDGYHGDNQDYEWEEYNEPYDEQVGYAVQWDSDDDREDDSDDDMGFDIDGDDEFAPDDRDPFADDEANEQDGELHAEDAMDTEPANVNEQNPAEEAQVAAAEDSGNQGRAEDDALGTEWGPENVLPAWAYTNPPYDLSDSEVSGAVGFDPNEQVGSTSSSWDDPPNTAPAPRPTSYSARLARPVEHLNLTFNRLDCNHSWSNRGGSQQCAACDYYMPYYYNECSKCKVRVCDYCRYDFHGRSERYEPGCFNMIGVIQWAEAGAPPFRQERHAQKHLLTSEAAQSYEDTLICAAFVFEGYPPDEESEDEIFKRRFYSKYLWYRFPLYNEMPGCWDVKTILVEKNVGIQGVTMLFPDSNSYSPLSWVEAENKLDEEVV